MALALVEPRIGSKFTTGRSISRAVFQQGAFAVIHDFSAALNNRNEMAVCAVFDVDMTWGGTAMGVLLNPIFSPKSVASWFVQFMHGQGPSGHHEILDCTLGSPERSLGETSTTEVTANFRVTAIPREVVTRVTTGSHRFFIRATSGRSRITRIETTFYSPF